MKVESERVKNSIRLLIGLAILTVVLFVGDLIFNRKGSVKEMFSGITNNKILETYNGVYTNHEDLGYRIVAYSGCSVESVDNQILIINDDFYLFRTSCMGTFFKEKGHTDDLNIIEKDKAYEVHYKDITYKRDYKTMSIVQRNTVASKEGYLDLNSLNGIVKETMSNDEYYDIERNVDGLDKSSPLLAIFKHKDDGDFSLSFWKYDDKLYEYTIHDINKMPLYYTYGGNLVMLERESSDSLYSYKFKVLTRGGMTYNLAEKLPVNVDGESLDYNKSVFIVYDQKDKEFKMFIGNDKKFCVENGNKDKIAFYEFSIKYNYQKNEFDNPLYVKKWYEHENCDYINQYLKGAV